MEYVLHLAAIASIVSLSLRYSREAMFHPYPLSQFLATLWEVLSCYQVLMQIFIFVDLD